MGTFSNTFGEWGGGGAMSRFAFQSDNLDFTNNLWLDKSGNNNHLSLVGGNALSVINDLTITLNTPRIGGVIDTVNGSSTTTGFTINGSGHIVITAAQAVDILWSIKLVSGEEFRFTTGVGQFIFAANNFGTISGTVNTDYAWTTTDAYHGNLQYGFSKMAYVNATHKTSFHTSYYLRTYQPFTLHWEGFFTQKSITVGLFNNNVENGVQALSVFAYKNAQVWMTCRDWNISFITTDNKTALDNVFIIEIKYNGNGVTNVNNWTLTLNGINCTLTSQALDGNDRNLNCWSGCGTGKQFTGFVKTYYVDYDKLRIWAIKDGVPFGYNLVDKPTDIAYIPAFNGIEAMGSSITNRSYTNAHNCSETKIKFPANANIISNDYNHYLIASNGTPNSLSANELYPNIGNKVWCDNHIDKKVTNIIISKSTVDLTTSINGFKDLFEIGIRSDGPPGTLVAIN